MRRADLGEQAAPWGTGSCPRLLALLCLLPLLGGILFPPPCRGDLVDLLNIPVLVPERDVSLKDEHPVPWKKAWDEARYFVRSGAYPDAEKKYEEVLSLKGNIEEARWEYGRLLLKKGDWEKAAATMELLVEKEPERVEYLNGLGLVLRKLGHFSRALEVFRKAHEKEPADMTALAGLAQGLVEVGRKKEAFPLFEKIFARRPADLAIHRALANLAFELGRPETARKLMMPLVRGKDADLDTLLMTARIYEELKDEKAATIYWQRCLKLDHDNREARGRLALHFEKAGTPGKALPHLLALLENDPLNASLLSRVCRILIQTDRFTEALPYFERYVSLQPDNLDALLSVSKGKIDSGSDAISLYRRLLAVTPNDLELLDALANDLLMAGDTETALFMWEHVARLYPDRVDVYQEIVDLLESLGRDERLAEVLEVLHRLAPGEIKVVSKLANLKVAQGDLPLGLEYYNKLEKAGYKGEDLFAGRGALYEDLGNYSRALLDYKKLLVMQPDRHDIRRRCLPLASKLGENQFLSEQVDLLDAAENAENRDRDLLLVAQAFAAARDFEHSLFRYQRLLVSLTGSGAGQKGGGDIGSLERQARLGLADLYRQEGLVFEAEQILRELFLGGGAQNDILKRLFDLALPGHDPKEADAAAWLGQYVSQNVGSGWALIMKARFFAAAGDYDKAENLLERLVYVGDQGDGAEAFSDRNAEVVRQAGLLLVEIFIEDDDLVKAERQCLAMLGTEQDLDVLVLLQKIYFLDGEAEGAANIFSQLLTDADDNFKLLRLAELFRKYGLPASQVAAAEKVLLNAPGSLAAAFSLAEGWVIIGKSRDAIKLLEKMASLHPDNSSIIMRIARYYYLNEQYASALRHCEMVLAKNPQRLDAQFLKTQCVVALDDYEYAENIVKQLFPIRTAVVLEKDVAAAGIKVVLPPVQKTLLQLLTFSSGQRFSLARELMSARHMTDISTEEKKELNFIAASLYARYRWEQEFGKVVALPVK